MMSSDKQIVKSVLRGEITLFEELVKKYSSKLMGFFYKMGLSKPDAEDLTQDTFVKVYENLPRYDEHWEFSTWLYKIASNTCKDFFKKPHPLTSSLDDNLPQSPTHCDPLERMLLHQDIQRLLQILKPDVRAMLLLHYYNGLTLYEIGKLYRLSPDAVKMKLLRGREKLLKPNSNLKTAVIL